MYADVFDDFDFAPDPAIWTFIDPLDDAQIEVQPAASGGSELVLSVPAGVKHDAFTGMNSAPRLVRAAPAGDFTLTARFTSIPSMKTQDQGLMLEDGSGAFLRFDVFSQGSGLRAFAAKVDGLQATSYLNTAIANGSEITLRVLRIGTVWTFQYSLDGVTFLTAVEFSDSLQPATLGPYVSNAGANPAYSSRVDFVSIEFDEPADSGNQDSDGDGVIDADDAFPNDPNEFADADLDDIGDAADPDDDNDGTPDVLDPSPLVPNEPVAGDDVGATFFDDFDSFPPDPDIWMVVDPLGDGKLDIQLDEEEGSELVLSVPAGLKHDAFTGMNNALRLIRSAPPGDFTLEARFTSIPSLKIQDQGLMLEDGTGSFLRFDVFSQGTVPRIFAANVNAIQATTYVNTGIANGSEITLRVTRVGTSWTFEYSYDGTEFTTAIQFMDPLVPITLGPYVSNAGSNPAFSARIDFVALDSEQIQDAEEAWLISSAVPSRASPGASVVVQLPSSAASLGYGSLLGGVDAQRGAVSFVLCVPSIPGCNPSSSISPRQGYRMTTTFVTRGQADGASRAAGTRVVGAVFEVPIAGSDSPPPGTYSVEARITPPDGVEQPLASASSLSLVQITDEIGDPTPLTFGTMAELVPLVASIPRPAVNVMQSVAEGQSPAVAADLMIDFPSDKVQIVGVHRAASAAVAELIPVDGDTVRVVFMRNRKTSPPMGGGAAEAAFELVFELLEGAGPVLPQEFQIKNEVSHGLDGNILSGSRFSVHEVF